MKFFLCTSCPAFQITWFENFSENVDFSLQCGFPQLHLFFNFSSTVGAAAELSLMNAIFRAFDLRPIDGNLKLKCEEDSAWRACASSKKGAQLVPFFSGPRNLDTRLFYDLNREMTLLHKTSLNAHCDSFWILFCTHFTIWILKSPFWGLKNPVSFVQ